MSKRAVAIIDYGMGNLASVKKAFEKIGADAMITRDKAVISGASLIILPGVGAFGDGMKNLSTYGLVDILTHCVLEKKIAFLGICLGMQLLAEHGQEFGDHTGLGWIQGDVQQLSVEAPLRLPHIGWNDIEIMNTTSLFENIIDLNFYFDHSFALESTNPSTVLATCTYGHRFAAVIKKGNITAVQFHPEKSQDSGLQFLKNVIDQEYAKS